MRVRDVSFSFASAPVLDGLSFAVRKGEFLAILGPNGSGKTTLLRALSRIHRPSAGQVLLEENDLWRLTANRVAREMAAVLQEARLDFDFTVAEAVMLGRTPHLRRWRREGEEDRRACREAMRLCRIEGLSGRPVTELSGGERRRVFIAVALAQETGIILLDEPTSHLDISYQLEILDLLQGLKRQRMLTVIAVLHDLNLAARYADRVLLMKEGRTFALGEPVVVLTVENIRAVYGIEALVAPHPVHGCPCVVPVGPCVVPVGQTPPTGRSDGDG